jgi:hypothetical protein
VFEVCAVRGVVVLDDAFLQAEELDKSELLHMVEINEFF